MRVDAAPRYASALGWFSLAVTVGLVALMLHAGDPGNPDWWGYAAPFALWVCGPAIAPWLIARRWPRRIVVRAMVGFLLVSSALAALAYWDAFFRSTSSTAALVLVFVPLWQWLGLAAVAVVALVLASRTSR